MKKKELVVKTTLYSYVPFMHTVAIASSKQKMDGKYQYAIYNTLYITKINIIPFRKSEERSDFSKSSQRYTTLY